MINEEKKSKKKTATARIAVIAVCLILLFGILTSVFSSVMYRSSAIESYASQVLGVANAVSAVIDTERFAVSIEGDEPDEYWADTERRLEEVFNRVDDLAYLYIIIPYRDGLFSYYVSSALPGEFLVVETDEEIYELEAAEAFRERQPTVSGITDAGEWGILVSAFSPIVDADGNVLGLVGADIYADRAIDSAFEFTLTTVIFSLVGSIIIGLILLSLLSRAFRPLSLLADWMQAVSAEGNIELTAEKTTELKKYTARKDIFGNLFASYESLTVYLLEICEDLTRIANGELDLDIKARSGMDKISLTLQKTINDLNSTFAEIQQATSRVSSGSEQIAGGSQSLAQGSTEQAATVQQLSASAAEISEKTKANAEMASKAAELAMTIKNNAEKGSGQMDEMVDAVGDISQASQSISKVIKVIDDIAFQTNILALNAAVEAARAGQHGKGFAVVAEEVRTLAAKSAEAAKDTGVLISDSMEKAEHGAQIAKETAESLIEIVTGINESNEVISEIATSSEEQSAGIEQINNGIDQVAKVVQQNSATAEESAATAEELSGQSSMLEKMVARFKLKDGSSTARLEAPKAHNYLPPGLN